MLSNVLATHNSVDSGFYSGEVLILVLLQGICLGNGCINLSVVSVFVLQGCNRIFNSLCHCIYFALLGNVLATHNSVDSGFHTREVLILILLQGICLGNGYINLCIVSTLVLQVCNRIFDCFRHCIHFALLGNIFTTNNSIDSSFHPREIFVVILIQSICFGNGCIYLSIISILILQCSNCIFDSLRHLVYFRLLRNFFTTNNSIDSGFHTREIFVLILIQSICFGNGCINISVVGRLDTLQGKGYAFTFSTVVFVGNGVFVTIHCQRVSTYFPTAPVACLDNVKVSRQGGKVKCAVIANNDLVDITVTIQTTHICVADIQRGQLVVSAVQISQRRILADIQRGQPVFVAV